MSSTNHTANYGLSQFLGTDKPAWLVDYNGDMSAIDTQMKANADAAAAAQTTANTADGKADTNATAISTLNTQINGASGIATDVTSLQGSVNTINSLIGNGEPTTTDKTLIGAINEINADVSGILGIKTWHSVKSISGISGSSTFQELATAVLAEINALIAGINDDERLVIEGVNLDGYHSMSPIRSSHYSNSDSISSLEVSVVYNGASVLYIGAMTFASDQKATRTSIAYADGAVTLTNFADDALISTGNITGAGVRYSIYKVL